MLENTLLRIFKHMCRKKRPKPLKSQTQERLNFSFVVRCSLLFVRCSLLFARCSLFSARCSIFSTRCSLLSARCRLPFGRYWLLFARCSLLSRTLYVMKQRNRDCKEPCCCELFNKPIAKYHLNTSIPEYCRKLKPIITGHVMFIGIKKRPRKKDYGKILPSNGKRYWLQTVIQILRKWKDWLLVKQIV